MLPFNAGKDALRLVSVGVYCDAPKFDNMSGDRKLRVSVNVARAVLVLQSRRATCGSFVPHD